MAGTNTAAQPITVFKVIGGPGDALPLSMRLPLAALQTLAFGTIVQIVAGFVQAAGTIAAPTLLAGVSSQAGDNLATAGTAPFGGSSIIYGRVPNQPAAVNIPIGAPPMDGTLGVILASDSTIFDGVTDAAHVLAATDVGSVFGLTKDATTGQWFVDTTITTPATGACAEVTELIDPIGVGAFGVGTTGGRVAWRFTRPCQQLFQ